MANSPDTDEMSRFAFFFSKAAKYQIAIPEPIHSMDCKQICEK